MADGRSWRLVRADTDAVPTSVRRFMARARKRRLRAAMPWAIALGVLLVAGGVAYVFYSTSVFGVRHVTVQGTSFLTPDQVRAAVGVPAEEPLARVDTGKVAARVLGLAPVKDVVVRRSWPSTLVIEVVERTAVAAVPAGTGYSLIDGSGVPYRQVATKPVGMPVIRVTSPGENDVDTRSALVVLGSLSSALRAQLVTITVPAPAQIQLQMIKGKTIVWGDDSESATKSQVATALLSRPEKTIDVSAPHVVTIR